MTIPADVLYASQQIREWLAELGDRASLATQNQSVRCCMTFVTI